MATMMDAAIAVKKQLEMGIPIQINDQPYNIKLEKDGLYLETKLGQMRWILVPFEKKVKE
jgi:hypothetical protein